MVVIGTKLNFVDRMAQRHEKQVDIAPDLVARD
jgi:hypothetical protein